MPVVRAARRALPAALLLALGLLLPAGAQAAATMSVSGSTLTFVTSDGLDHETYPYLGSNGHLRIDDPGGIAFGPPPATTVPLPARAPNAFHVTGPPALAMRGATATVDTGRTVSCPAGGPACRLRATARPGGASAKVRGRPTIAGTAQTRLGAGASAKVAIRLTPKAARLLRSKGRITLAVNAVLERGAARHAASSFAVTVRAPKHRR